MSLNKDFDYNQYVNAEKLIKNKIESLIAKYEDKIKSAEFLKHKAPGIFNDPPTKADKERLDARIYERGTFIEDLKELYKMLDYYGE